MNEQKLSLDGRLSAAAEFVRENSVVADIGTDHAFLPISLILSGKTRFAVASDVNRGPLERARADAEKYGVTDRMHFALSDGLDGFDAEKYGVTDIVICGMGGELIEKIVRASDYTKKSGVRLVLQPMTFAPELRVFLLSNGYNILNEKLCAAAGRIYTVISAEYDGIKREYTESELLLGKKNIENCDKLLCIYAEKLKNKLEIQINGKTRGGIDCDEEKNAYEEICRITEELQHDGN